jgi:methanogenic corrinoid protein MtbC1
MSVQRLQTVIASSPEIKEQDGTAGWRANGERCAVNGHGAADDLSARLVHAIETEVIPRLVLARRANVTAPLGAARGEWAPRREHIEELANLVLGRDVVVAAAYVDGLRAQGASVETVYLDVLAPTARRLGELWSEDLCDFGEVTIGLCRLQEILHELSPAFYNEAERHEVGLRALLIPAPGEQHSFGLYMVTEFFRRAGWDVWSGPHQSRSELLRLVHDEWFSIVGLSVSGEARLDSVATGIRMIRKASRNRNLGVMVGGPVFLEHPEYVALVGADATATNGRQAPVQAQNMLALLANRD